MKPLLPVEEALERVLAGVPSLPQVETSGLIEAPGRILAVDVASPIDVPGEDNSAMDGYALRAVDAGRALPVVQRIPAGTVGAPLEPGTAARIFTGAPLPPGADSVVMQEDCTEENGAIQIACSVSPGDHVRPRGQDLPKGGEVLARGRRLRPQDLGLLASIGCAQVDVYRRLKVAVLSTGDELVEPGQGEVGPGQVYNSNRYTLIGLLRNLGLDVLDFGIVPDDARATGEALQRAANEADCVISSGGVSVGEEDHVKAQVERYGELSLWKLAIKPGKPLAFGALGSIPFMGLPGNPTSVFVTFCLIARPFLMRAQGMAEPPPPRQYARADFAVSRAGTRQDYLRVSLASAESGLSARKYPNQSSGVLSSVCHSDALAVIPPGRTIAPGDEVEVLPLDSFY